MLNVIEILEIDKKSKVKMTEIFTHEDKLELYLSKCTSKLTYIQ